MADFFVDRPSAGGKAGQAFGTGLQALAEQKLQQVQQRNMAQKLSQGLQQYGVDKQKAEAISQFTPELQQLAFKEIAQGPRNAQFADTINQIIGGGQSQQGSPGAPQSSGLSEKQTLEAAKLYQTQRKIGTAERKEVREYLAPFEERYQKARKNIDENNQLIALAKSGKLRAGFKQEILDSLKLGNFWRPIENEYAQKNLARQAQNAGAAFNTSRLTNLDVNLYKQSLGTLWNTAKGLEAIARINKLESQALKAQHEARIQILRENKGEIPFDIERQIDERVGGRLKFLADKAMNIVTGNPVQSKTNGFDSINEALKNLKPGQTITDTSTGITYDSSGKPIGR